MSLLERAKGLQGTLVERRRYLHRHPEPSYKEERTSAFLAEKVKILGYKVREKQGGWGLIADLELKPGRPYVLLRADMDSLPILEMSGEPFSSEVPGQAHLCGHDSHCMMALGAAELLAQPEINPDRNVRFVFQSAEEIPPGGAIELIRSGCMEGVERAYALHVDPTLPTGSFGSRPGRMMAAINEFQITIQGKGGHAGYPHLAQDPVVVAARTIIGLQEIVSRFLPPLDPGVVSVCQIEGGHTFNVIPDSVYLCGTTRFYNTDWVDKARVAIEEIARGACMGTGCSANVVFKEGYPPLVNAPEEVERARKVVETQFPDGTFQEVALQGAGEDFARYLEQVPGAMVFIGIRNEAIGSTHFLHSARFKLDEECLWRGAAFLASLALDDSGK